MKVTFLLLATLCVLTSTAQNKYPGLNLPKKKNASTEILIESPRMKIEKLLRAYNSPKVAGPTIPHPVPMRKTDVYILPNGNKLIGNAPGQMPCIIPDMREYPNAGKYRPYSYHGLGKMPNVQEM